MDVNEGGDEDAALAELWENIKRCTGQTDLDGMMRVAEADIANWKLKAGVKKVNGSNYSIVNEDKWQQNQEIGDRATRLCHFLHHQFYVGDESDKKHRGKVKPRFGRWSDHTHDLRFDGTVDIFLTLQRMNDVKSNGIYYDPVPGHREFHLAGESIMIDQLRKLNVEMKNTQPGAALDDIIEGYDEENLCCVAIFFALRCIENPFAVRTTKDDEIDDTKRKVAMKEKDFRIDPLLAFYRGLSTQLISSPSQQVAIADIDTKLNRSRITYFIDHLSKCKVIGKRAGIVSKGEYFVDLDAAVQQFNLPSQEPTQPPESNACMHKRFVLMVHIY